MNNGLGTNFMGAFFLLNPRNYFTQGWLSDIQKLTLIPQGINYPTNIFNEGF